MFVGVGGGEYLSAEVAGDLDGGLSHTSGAGVDKLRAARRSGEQFDQAI